MRSHPLSAGLVLRVLAVCGLLLQASPAHADFLFPDFSSTAGLNLVGSAAQVGSDARVSLSAPTTGGGIWFTTKQDVQAGFEAIFGFRISALGGIADANGLNGGDGFAFVIQNTSDTALGLTNSYMAYEIANSLAIEFDTWRNGNFIALEPSSNHVGVQSLGTSVNSPFAAAFLGSAAVGPNMSDGNVHTAKITYLPGTLSIFVDDLGTPVSTISVDLDTLLNLDSGAAFVGFTAGGAAAFENHDLLSWQFSVVPEPSTLVFTAFGLLSMLGLCRPRRLVR